MTMNTSTGMVNLRKQAIKGELGRGLSFVKVECRSHP